MLDRITKDELLKQISDLKELNKRLIQEINDRKELESGLQNSEAKYRMLFNNASDLIFLHGVTPEGLPTKFVEVNDEACRKLEYSRAQFLTMTPLDISVLLEDQFKSRMKQLFLSCKLTAEDYLITKTGKSFPVELNIHLFQVAKERLIVTVARDITSRKTAEQALKESEERYRKLFEFSPDAMLVHSDGKIVFANNAAARLIGASSLKDVIGYPILNFLHPDYHELALNRINRIINQSEDVPFVEEKLCRLDGSNVDVEVLGVPFIYQGKPAVQLVVHDISERKKLESEMLRASKLESLGLLAGGIAHDFNNILTVILGNVSLGKLQLPKDNVLYDKFEEIELASNQARELTQQLLTFSKGGEPVKKTIALKELLIETVTLALSGTNVISKFDFSEEELLVNADESQLRQAINNLVINAVQAMPKGGTITAKAKKVFFETEREGSESVPPGHYLKLILQDEGQGIPQELLNKIFDPYFTTKASGNGLGLATTYSIIRKHGGKINVRSEVGRGTRFSIYLPISGDENLSLDTNTQQIYYGQGQILVMDDEASIRELLGRMLSKIGYDVEFASDGLQALKMYLNSLEQGKPFDAIILDLTVRGGMGGKETVQELLNLNPQAKVLVSTGYSNDAVIANYKEYGFVGAVTKPYKIEGLSKALSDVI